VLISSSLSRPNSQVVKNFRFSKNSIAKPKMKEAQIINYHRFLLLQKTKHFYNSAEAYLLQYRKRLLIMITTSSYMPINAYGISENVRLLVTI